MRKTVFASGTAVLLLVAATIPAFAAARGKADFTTFVALGDSFGVGISNLGATVKHQLFSPPAIIARQVGLRTDCTTDGPKCFQQALISEPGILPSLVLTSLVPPTIVLSPGQGAPINSGLPRPYNNLSVDGAEIADALNVDGDGNEAFSAPIVLRGLGSMSDQALSLKPTFIYMWLGGDDAFNGVQSGKPSNMTPLADFTRDYNAVLDKFVAGAPNAGMVVGNLPVDVSKVPFLTLILPVLINPSTGQPILDPSTGKTIPYIADLGGGNFGQLPAGSVVLLTARGDLSTGFGIPPALKPLLPPLPNIGKPLPDEDVLTPTELAAISQRITEYNAAIATAAAARNIPVADINGLFQRLLTGIPVGAGTGVTLNLNFVTGGVISLDAFHLTDMGYTLFSNEFIKTINSAYGSHIPVAPFSATYQNNAPDNTFGTASLTTPVFSEDAIRAMQPSSNATAATSRRRSAKPTEAPSRHRGAKTGTD